MNPGDISGGLVRLAAQAGIPVSESLARQLTVYYGLLTRWNRTINLTSLSDPEEAVNRLLLEPLAAAAHLPSRVSLIDLGSGGGSPAIPLALALGSPRLVMVESRTRKAAFLREVTRELGMAAEIQDARFEEVCERDGYRASFDLLSVRAVRLDATAVRSIAMFLRPRGQAALFGGQEAKDPQDALPVELTKDSTFPLLDSTHSRLTILRRA